MSYQFGNTHRMTEGNGNINSRTYTKTIFGQRLQDNPVPTWTAETSRKPVVILQDPKTGKKIGLKKEIFSYGVMTMADSGGGKTNLIDIKLSNGRKLSLETTWEQKIFFGDEFISLDEYVKKLFGRIPEFFSGADDLREKWANPDTREQLLRTMDEAGFAEEKLLLLKNMLKMQKCDLLDVLEYIAYDSTPIERAKRVELVKKQYVDSLNKEQREFDNLILQYYVSNGFKELGSDNLKTFITIKYNSMSDAKDRLKMSVGDIRAHYFELQRRLYRA